MNTNETVDKSLLDKINKIKLLLYPESFQEYSKIPAILSDDLTFKVQNLYNIKDIKTKVNDQNELEDILYIISKEPNTFLEITESKKECKIILNQKYMEYSFINIPFNYTEKDVKTLLKIKEGEYSRLYKQSIFWKLISEVTNFNENIENTINNIKIENKPLKCNITSQQMLLNIIKKEITNSKLKDEETDFINLNKKSYNDTYKGNEMSWRKKSDDSVDELGVKTNYFKRSNKRRQRFKSDPEDWNKRKKFDYNNNKFYLHFNDSEKNVDLQYSVKYPMELKYK